jgi:membrane fusion protein (multidrug efflux system)
MNVPSPKTLVHNKKVLIALGILLIVLVIAGGRLWRYYSTHVSTDDAFVEGRVSPVSPTVEGIVIEVLIDDNEEVEEDQILLRLEPKYYKGKLEGAKAAVTVAKAQLRAAEEKLAFSRESIPGQVAQAVAAREAASTAITASKQIRNQAKAMLASKEEALAVAEAELRESLAMKEKAKIDFGRMRSLVDKNAISQKDYDLAKLTYDAALAQLSGAERRVTQARRELDASRAELRTKETGYAYSSVHMGVKSAELKADEAEGKLTETRAKERGIGVREAEVELARAELKAAVAEMEYAKNEFEDTIIRAPLAGRVTKKTVEVGQFVHPGQKLMAVVSLEDIWIVANYKETQLTKVRPGQKVKITVDTYPDEEFPGIVDSIQAGTGARFSLLPPENATGNFVKVVQRIPVKIRLNNPTNPHVLRPGMSVIPTIALK